MLLPGISALLPVVSLYANDTTVIALSNSGIFEVFWVYAHFEATVGSRLNDRPVDIQWSSYKLKVLGVLVGYGDTGKANLRPVWGLSAIALMLGDPALSVFREGCGP